MRVIPVIDLMGGVVVRARGGARETYRPIETPLSPTAQAADMVAGLLRLHPFDTIYAADLDAIEGRGGHDALLAELEARFPQVVFWVDRGTATLAAAQKWLAARDRGPPGPPLRRENEAGHGAAARADREVRDPGTSLVIGSESQTDLALLRALGQNPRIVLSLDFRGDVFLGPPELLATPALWPQRVIVMTLARVGGGAGPDVERLAAIVATAGGRAIFAAGGLRDAGDLAVLEQAGAAGVLVASALHDGRLGAACLAPASGKVRA